jgi:hypothetical protein
MSIRKMNLAGVLATAATLGFAVGGHAQSTSGGPPVPSIPPGSEASGNYHGMPWIWITQGNHLWFCTWLGTAAPRGQQISCTVTNLPEPPR